MKRSLVPAVARASLLIVITSGVSWLAALLFNVSDSVLPVLGASAAAGILFFIRSRASRPLAITVSIVLYAAYLLAAAFLVMYIIVIPYAYYVSWLGLVRGGRPGGIISFIFFSSVAFFASLFLGLGNSHRIITCLAAVAFIFSTEALVIWQTAAAAAAFLGCALLTVFLLSLPQTRPPRDQATPLRRLTRSLPAFGLAVTVAALLSLGTRPGEGIFETRHLDPALQRTLIDAFPDLPVFASLAGQGFAFEEARLGEKPRLADTPLFRVKSERDKLIYLRTEIYDTYAANAWSKILISLGMGEGKSGGIIDAPAADSDPVTVTVLFDYLPLLPHRLSTQSIRLPDQRLSDIKAGSPETGFTLTLPLLKNDRIILSAGRRELSEETGRLRERIERATGIRIESQPHAPTETQTALLDTYRQVPAMVTPRTRELARELGRGKDRPWTVLPEIYRYLRSHCAYSLRTEAPPRGVDLVDEFLFTTRKGHAVHFTTAFIVLARLNGIPARFVKGFVVLVPPTGDTAEVKGLNAHAWPEVWFPELGWTTLEATPALDFFRTYGTEYYKEFNPDNDDLTARQLAAVMGGKIPPPEKKPPDVRAVVMTLLPYAGAAAAVPALAAAVFFLLRRPRRPHPYYRGLKRRIGRSLARLTAFAAQHGVPSPETIGWTAWGERFKRLAGMKPGRVDTVVRQVQRVYFGGRDPGPHRARFLRRAGRRLTSSRHGRSKTL